MKQKIKIEKNLLIRKTFPFVVFFYISRFLLFLSRNHWFLLWLSIELTTLAFIPIINNKSKRFVETIVIYFLIQAISSAFLIFGFLQNQILLLENQIFNICLIALIVKLSIAPFHSWFPPILTKIDKTSIILIFTFQKLQPFLFLFLNNPLRKVLFLFIILTCLTGSISNMIQNNIKLILSYSRISHGGWLLIALWINKRIWTLYLLVYFITIFLICKIFISNLTQIFSKTTVKFSWRILLISLAGIPPLIGFYPKIIVLEEILSITFFLILFILLITATVDFFIYTRTFYISFFNMSPSIIWINSTIKPPSTLIFLILRRFSLFILL